MITKSEKLSTYLTDDQNDLLEQGYHLLEHVNEDRDYKFDDYGFVVFPFAKLYEGFLKKVFLDAGFISRQDYLSKYFRIGKVMSPSMRKRLGRRSVYNRICKQVGCELSDRIWKTWKRGRNQVFHYFPHNLRSLTLQDAEDIVNEIVATMDEVVEGIKLVNVNKKLDRLTTYEVKKFRSETEKI